MRIFGSIDENKKKNIRVFFGEFELLLYGLYSLFSVKFIRFPRAIRIDQIKFTKKYLTPYGVAILYKLQQIFVRIPIPENCMSKTVNQRVQSIAFSHAIATSSNIFSKNNKNSILCKIVIFQEFPFLLVIVDFDSFLRKSQPNLNLLNKTKQNKDVEKSS